MKKVLIIALATIFILLVSAYITARGLTHGQPAWGHLGSIQGFRAGLVHLHQHITTVVIMTNTDTDNITPIIDGLIDVVLNHSIGESKGTQIINVHPVFQTPEDASVVETFQKETLFCDHIPTFEVKAHPDDWIDISLEWVVGTNPTIAEEVWKYHDHTIAINRQEIENLGAYTHDVEHYSVTSPDSMLEIWAKGLSIYLPPLPKGAYEIKWFSEIMDEFNNGWVDYKPGNYLEISTTLTVE